MNNSFVQGDTLSVLKTIADDTFDGGITSPPYNKRKNRKGGLVKGITYSDITDSLDEVEYQKAQIEVLNEIYRTMKPGGSFFYNHKVRWDSKVMIHPYKWLINTKWVMKQEIIWDRSLAANIRGWRFWQTDERIYWLYKPRIKGDGGDELLSKHALLSSIWRLRPEMHKKTVNYHPAPFPIEIPTRCLYSIFDDSKEKLIIDPYMGSGTTAVVCRLLGHNYYGIDISKEYITQATHRLSNITDREVVDFESEVALHVVKKTYKERKLEAQSKVL